MIVLGYDYGVLLVCDGVVVGMCGGLVEFVMCCCVIIVMCMVMLLLFGLIVFGNFKVNLLFDLSYLMLIVCIEYIGVVLIEIEILIIQLVEEVVGVVKNLCKLKLVLCIGQSDVVLEFVWGINMDQVSLEVCDKMEVLNLLLEVKVLVLLCFNLFIELIMCLVLLNRMVLISDVDVVCELIGLCCYVDEDLKKKLELVIGVVVVKVGGGLEDEIQVDIDQQKLVQLNLLIDIVIKCLKDENINIFGGCLEEGLQCFLVCIVNQFVDFEEICNLLVIIQVVNGSVVDLVLQQMFNIVVLIGFVVVIVVVLVVQSVLFGGGFSVVVNGVLVCLKDVVIVCQGYKECEVIICLGGKELVELVIYKEGDVNIVFIVEVLCKCLEQIKGMFLFDVELIIIEDQLCFIEYVIVDVKKDVVIGGLLVILIIFLFLCDGWSMFVISLLLLVLIIVMFFFMGQFGLSLNVMLLGGLVLVIGLVVDDLIVVLESIVKVCECGLGILQVVIVGICEVSMVVVVLILIIIVVFLLLVFVDGIVGQLFCDQVLIVVIVIVILLLVLMILILMLSLLKGWLLLVFLEEVLNVVWQLQKCWQKLVVLGCCGVVVSVCWSFYVLVWFVVCVWCGVVVVVGLVMCKVSDLVMKFYVGVECGYLCLLLSVLVYLGKVLGVVVIIFVVIMVLVLMFGVDLILQLVQDWFEMMVKLFVGMLLKQIDVLVCEL